MDKPELITMDEREMLSALAQQSVTRVIHHGELRKPTLQDLFAQAELADSECDYRHYERFNVMVIEMFGNDTTMARALIGQIHALQEQIRRMRGDGK